MSQQRFTCVSQSGETQAGLNLDRAKTALAQCYYRHYACHSVSRPAACLPGTRASVEHGETIEMK